METRIGGARKRWQSSSRRGYRYLGVPILAEEIAKLSATRS
jgi:hypothetical protein